jgi:hypothetical protein
VVFATLSPNSDQVLLRVKRGGTQLSVEHSAGAQEGRDLETVMHSKGERNGLGNNLGSAGCNQEKVGNKSQGAVTSTIGINFPLFLFC